MSAIDSQLKSRLVLQAAVLKAAKALHDEDRARMLDALDDGERVVATSSDGTKLGTISRTAPKPAAYVDDVAAVCATLGPEDFDYEIPARSMGRAIELIREHAPELLDFAPKAHILAELERRALDAHKAGEELPPGLAIRQRAGTLSIRTTEDALDAGARILTGAQLGEIEQ